MKNNIIVNYVIAALTALVAGLQTLTGMEWAHVASIAISAIVGIATAASGSILAYRAVKNGKSSA